MNRPTWIAVSLAARLARPADRDRKREEWGADLRDAAAAGIRPSSIAAGALASSVRDLARRRRVLACATVAVAVAAAITVPIAHVTAPLPTRAAAACGATARSIGTVSARGSARPSEARLDRTIGRAIGYVKPHGFYEGVWYVPSSRRVCVGVSGSPNPTDLAAMRAAVRPTGVAVTFVAQAASAGQLHAIQDALPGSKPGTYGILDSDIDEIDATVTADIARHSPVGLEADLRSRFGPRLVVTRSTSDIGIIIQPATGRMPLASDGSDTRPRQLRPQADAPQ